MDNLGNAISLSKERFDNTVCHVKKDLGERIENVDEYLKTSALNTPLSAALDVTEKVWDHFLPEETLEGDDEPNDTDKKNTEGPVLRAGRLSQRLQRQTLAGLQQMSLRNPDSRKAMGYCVDLIQVRIDSFLLTKVRGT